MPIQMDGFARPWQLERLDQVFNEGTAESRGRLRDAIASGKLGGGFREGSIFSVDAVGTDDAESTRRHWLEDWVGDPPRRGGNFWPYANEIDVAELLRQGLLESLDRVIRTGKVHNNVWVPHGPAPVESVVDQRALFAVWVQESHRVVTLVIETPVPSSATGSLPGLVSRMQMSRGSDNRISFAGWSRPPQAASGLGAEVLRRATEPRP